MSTVDDEGLEGVSPNKLIEMDESRPANIVSRSSNSELVPDLLALLLGRVVLGVIVLWEESVCVGGDKWW